MGVAALSRLAAVRWSEALRGQLSLPAKKESPSWDRSSEACRTTRSAGSPQTGLEPHQEALGKAICRLTEPRSDPSETRFPSRELCRSLYSPCRLDAATVPLA